MRRVGQALSVSHQITRDPASLDAIEPPPLPPHSATTAGTDDKLEAVSAVTAAAAPTTPGSAGGKKQPSTSSSSSSGKSLVSPAKRKDGAVKKVQGYTLFCQEARERITSENEGMPFRELQKKFGEAWRALDKADKDRYGAQADELNRQAEAAVAAEEATLKTAQEEERRRRGLERKEQLLLEKRRQEEEQERKIVEKLTGKMVRQSTPRQRSFASHTQTDLISCRLSDVTHR
jgi:hypothetical protein